MRSEFLPSDISELAARFDIEGLVVSVDALGNGLINDTYLVTTTSAQYVLQRINNAVFKDVALLQGNIAAVTAHIRRKLEAASVRDLDRRVLRLIPVKGAAGAASPAGVSASPADASASPAGGATYLEEDGKFWRMTLYISGSHTCEEVNAETSYCAGKAFGEFEAMLSDIPAEIGETIPDFHNMELRARQLDEAVAADRVGRLAANGTDGLGMALDGAGLALNGSSVALDGAGLAARPGELQEILEFFGRYRSWMCQAEQMHREGVLPKRICHCDTKVNNLLFDEEGKPLCVIDLDTVMPSFVFSDFGDFMRTGASTVAEDWPAISDIEFRKDVYDAFLKGYLESASCFLTPIEKDNLPFAVLLFPYMQAVRFFTDYLNGDTYYKISYPEHNLVRTRNQITLFRKAGEALSLL
ncbi:MAG: phosphotransferase [Bacteroidales bacterium]|nr:phosphotransferase [Bacteroidales bacterium]